jgi:hypothetical protein
MKRINIYLLLSLLVVFSACETSDLETQEPNSGVQDLRSLSIPDGFDFSTERPVTLTINDETPWVKYNVYGYNSDYGNEAENIANALDHMLYEGRPSAGKINHELSLSNAYDKVYISRKDGLEYTFEIKDITNNIINFSSELETKAGPSTDTRTICGCSAGEDIINDGFEDQSGAFPLPAKNIQTNENNILGWSTTSTDGLIEIWSDGFKGIASNEGTQFAEINATQEAALYQRICTTPNSVISWSIAHRGREGEDVASVKIGPDVGTAPVVATMVTDNIPGGVDEDVNGWKTYSGTYTIPDGQYDTFIIFESVSTSTGNPSVGNLIDNILVTQTGGDPCVPGIGTIIYPGGLEQAHVAFEDLWPSQGDYDFNDLVIAYRIVYNTLDDDITSMTYFYEIVNIGATYLNGFGVEFPFDESLVASITGQLDGNSGALSGDNGAVIRFFDTAQNYLNDPRTLEVTFTSPQLSSTIGLGGEPYNLFLTEDQDNDFEVHLPGEAHTGIGTKPTTFPSFAPEVLECGNLTAEDNHDTSGDYSVDTGVSLLVPYDLPTGPTVVVMENMPWALNISGEYVSPLPCATIILGHLKFEAWAKSNGTTSKKWFLDNSGNRNDAYLDN